MSWLNIFFFQVEKKKTAANRFPTKNKALHSECFKNLNKVPFWDIASATSASKEALFFQTDQQKFQKNVDFSLWGNLATTYMHFLHYFSIFSILCALFFQASTYFVLSCLGQIVSPLVVYPILLRWYSILTVTKKCSFSDDDRVNPIFKKSLWLHMFLVKYRLLFLAHSCCKKLLKSRVQTIHVHGNFSVRGSGRKICWGGCGGGSKCSKYYPWGKFFPVFFQIFKN